MSRDHLKFHWLEKIQVQLATAAAVIVVYFLAWPLLRPNDPRMAATFVYGDGCNIVMFAIMVCVLAVGCAAVTVTSRPEGAILAVAFGAGGISLRSPRIRSLLWSVDGSMGTVMSKLIVEVLEMAVVAALAVIIVLMVRKLIATINHRLVWKNPLADLTEDQRQETVQSIKNARLKKNAILDESMRFGLLVAVFREATVFASGHAGKRIRGLAGVIRCAACLLLGMILAVVLLVVMMRSADRGQIIFALVASFTIAVLAAHQIFPASFSIIAWMMPILTAVAFYSWTWMTLSDVPCSDWTALPLYARALPVDWMTAGGGGAMLGYWISERIHELRYLEHRKETEGV